MALLLDTHVWVWAVAEPARLGKSTRELLKDPEPAVYLATISIVELARLERQGRIELRTSLEEWVERSIDLLLAKTLPLTHEIACAAYALPGDRPVERPPASTVTDPIDQILVATARAHDLQLATADEALLASPHVTTHDAGQ